MTTKEMFICEFHHDHFGWLTYDGEDQYPREFSSQDEARRWLALNPSPYRQRVTKSFMGSKTA